MNKIIVVLFLVIAAHSYGQSDQQLALKLGQRAIESMDNGNIEEAIKLLEECEALDPDNINYPYEKAYAHYLNKNYNDAIIILEKLTKHKQANDRIYQMLGNSYDLQDKQKKAIEVYEHGMKLFPQSGILHLERGNIELINKNYNEALAYYEKGIEVQPDFSSNYYRAAKLFLNSNEEVWGMIYGEIFMNLERNSNRTPEISKMLFDTYKSGIQLYGDSSRIDFCNIVIDAEDVVNKKNFTPPFCMVFGQAMVMATIDMKQVDLNTLDLLRSTFVDNYYQQEHNKSHPVVLFEYQKQLKEAGHAEAYNHWILMQGDTEAFNKWYDSNKDKWDGFVAWFSEHPIEINASNTFVRGRY